LELFLSFRTRPRGLRRKTASRAINGDINGLAGLFSRTGFLTFHVVLVCDFNSLFKKAATRCLGLVVLVCYLYVAFFIILNQHPHPPPILLLVNQMLV
jgi:hypothetical protein